MIEEDIFLSPVNKPGFKTYYTQMYFFVFLGGQLWHTLVSITNW